MSILKFTLASFLIFSLSIQGISQYSHTKKYNFKSQGEFLEGLTKLNNGYLATSRQFGNSSNLKSTLRKINADESIAWVHQFDSTYSSYFHPVVTNEDHIFCFGTPQTPPMVDPTTMHFSIMDTNFNIQVEKKIELPFGINLCQFFPAKDGGVIGIVNETCNYSRIMRIDRDGVVLWFESFIPIVAPPGGTGSSRIQDIYYMGNDNYMIVGFEGYGKGIMYFKIDDDGNYLDSKYYETVPGVDICYKNDYNGTNFISVIEGDYDGKHTVLLEVDSNMEVVQSKKLIFSDSLTRAAGVNYQNSNVIVTKNISNYPSASCQIFSIDLTNMTQNWGIKTLLDGSQIHGFADHRSLVKNNNQLVFANSYGQLNLSNNGGNNFDFWSTTHVNPNNGNGYCDATPAAVEIESHVPIQNDYDMIKLSPTNWVEQTYSGSFIDQTPEQAILVCEIEQEDHTSISNFDLNNVAIFPNPATDFITIAFENTNTHSIQIYSTLGELVFSNSSLSKTSTINVEHFVTGVYLIIIENEGVRQSKKIVIN